MRADDVIVIDDEGDEVQVDIPAPEAPPLSIKIEHEEIPQETRLLSEEARKTECRDSRFPTGQRGIITRLRALLSRGGIQECRSPR